jgi:hypothetical protein
LKTIPARQVQPAEDQAVMQKTNKQISRVTIIPSLENSFGTFNFRFISGPLRPDLL